MDDGYRSGFVTLVGRPNAGKSTLLNKILGQKVSIVSNKPQTTRTQVRGVLTSDTHQVVFVDTPGIHKPRSALGTSLNATANDAIGDVDVVCLVLDATAPYGRGDAFIAESLPGDAIVVVTKADIASPNRCWPNSRPRPTCRQRPGSRSVAAPVRASTRWWPICAGVFHPDRSTTRTTW